MDKEYNQMVTTLTKSGVDILQTLTASRSNLIHMAMGVSGEAGELLDAVKKHVIYNKPLDTENLIEELGDLEFYMQGLRDAIGVTREDVMQQNMTKLSERYDGYKYSDKAAQLRADKFDV